MKRYEKDLKRLQALTKNGSEPTDQESANLNDASARLLSAMGFIDLIPAGDRPSSSAARSWLIPVLSLALWYRLGHFLSIVFSSFPRYHVTIHRANGTMGMI